jgi:hypothetical protein
VTIDLRADHILIGMVGDAGGVYQATNGGTFALLLSTLKTVALALSDDGNTLYALDSATNLLLELDMATLSSQSWPLDGLVDPIALTSTKDATHRAIIYVAGRNDRLLKVFDSSTHEVLASVPLNFQPNVIEPLGSNSLSLGSRLTSDDILWSFTNAPQPVVYFVPAMPLQLRGNPQR